MSRVVASRRCRQTGTTVQVIDNRDFTWSEDSPWFVVCDTHGTLLASDTFRHARWFSASPADFCEDCADILDNREN